MSNFFHLTLLAAALIALLISSSCIQLAPAQSPPPFSLPPCSPNSSWVSGKAPIDELTLNLTLFKLSFLTNQSVSFTFTTTYNYGTEEDDAAYLALIILARPPLQAEPATASAPCLRERYSLSQPLQLQYICDPSVPPQTQAPTTCLSEPTYPYDSNDTQFKKEVSLIYDAATTDLHLEQVFHSRRTTENDTITFDLQPDAVDSRVSNDSLTLFVGYIMTSWEASINVTNNTEYVTTGAPPRNNSEPPMNGSSFAVLDDDDDAKSNHEKLLVWVIVGVSMMALLMGLLILVLFIAKRRHRCPSLVSSRLASGAPPLSTTSKGPFSHQALETSTTPCTMKALALSPPHDGAFQGTGPATWLKPPNPR